MIDRTIPFYNIILRRDSYLPQKVFLPDGFDIVPYRDGYEEDWARLEYAVGDFDSAEEARNYFVSSYLREKDLTSSILFLRNPDGRVIGSCIAWKDKRGCKDVSSLHWLVVDEAYQGRKLGRALCLSVMNHFEKTSGMPVYIHTQPWSWKAVLLYLSVGFRIQKTDTFSNYENQYDSAMATLREVVSPEQFDMMTAMSD